jgi:hypothetical protein
MAKSQIGKCEIMEHHDSDVLCGYPKCKAIKKKISVGMYIVEYGGKHYHANCAKQLQIDFKVPIPKKRKKDE